MPPTTPRLTATDVLQMIRDRAIRAVDLRHTSLEGRWQHETLLAEALTHEMFTQGLSRSGSHGTLWPDPATAVLDPFREMPTLILICDTSGPEGAELGFDTRRVARRAEALLTGGGVADAIEFEFLVDCFFFDDVQFAAEPHGHFWRVDTVEGTWNTGQAEQPNLALRSFDFDELVPPVDHYCDLRTEIMLTAQTCGLTVRRHSHGSAPGQATFLLHVRGLVAAGDALQQFKYVVKQSAAKYGKSATFMPLPLAEQGSGIQVDVRLTRHGRNVLQDERTGNLTALGRHFAAGWLAHALTLVCLATPSLNGLKRWAGREGVTMLRAHARQHPGTLVGVLPHALRFRLADATANPYLLPAALVLAGVDGVAEEKKLGEPVELLDEHTQETLLKLALPKDPRVLLSAVAEDREFLLNDGVCPEDFAFEWEMMLEAEYLPKNDEPTARDFELHYDC